MNSRIKNKTNGTSSFHDAILGHVYAEKLPSCLIHDIESYRRRMRMQCHLKQANFDFVTVIQDLNEDHGKPEWKVHIDDIDTPLVGNLKRDTNTNSKLLLDPIPPKPVDENTSKKKQSKFKHLINKSVKLASTTVHGKRPPSQPRDVKANALSITSIELTWQSPSRQGSAPIDEYSIIYSIDPSFQKHVHIHKTELPRTEAQLTGLIPAKIHYFQVSAISDIGESERSEIIQFDLRKDGPSVWSEES